MSPGRTTWWPCDAAEHDRELIVELGDEFGAEGPYLMRVLKDLAQAQRDEGSVRTGFRVISKKAFVGSPDRARLIVEYAARIGVLDDLAIDDDGRRFTCRVSGWKADQARGREAIKKAGQRASGTTEGHVPEKGDSVPQERDMSPLDGDVSRCVPPTRDNQTRTEKESPAVPEAVVGRAKLAAVEGNGEDSLIKDVVGILQRGIDSLTGDEPCKTPTAAAVREALEEHPVNRDTAVAVAMEVRSIAQSQNRAPNIVGLFRQKLSGASIGRVA